jgi:CubicO group peptidase (beta-lactamase class C family)
MKKKILCLSSVLLLLAGCASDSSAPYVYSPPEDITDGLDVGTLDEVNINQVPITDMVTRIRDGEYREVHSMLLFKDGKLVFEEYFKGHRFAYEAPDHHGELVAWNRTMLHRIMSVTKSVCSACVGIAVDKGFIGSVHQSIFDYLPDHQHFEKDGKGEITIEHLLTMRSGLDWNEWALPYSNPNNDVIMSYQAEDAIAYYLNKPLSDKPGVRFNYSGGCNILLGEIIKNAAGLNLDEFSGKYLFEPLGIDPYYWIQYNNGTIDAGGGLRIKPRDMMKIGVAFLNGGMWNGQRVISEEWVEKSATPFPGNSWLNDWNDHYGMKGYSYMWWTHHFIRSGKKVDMFYASGWGGQFIMIIPELSTVAVFTCGYYVGYRPPFEILKKYILPAYR